MTYRGIYTISQHFLLPARGFTWFPRTPQACVTCAEPPPGRRSAGSASLRRQQERGAQTNYFFGKIFFKKKIFGNINLS